MDGPALGRRIEIVSMSKAEARESYRENPYVFRCANFRATAVAKITPKAYLSDGTEVDDPRDPFVRFFRSPNPNSSWRSLVFNMQMDLALRGNAYAYVVETIKGLEAWHIPARDVSYIPNVSGLGHRVALWQFSYNGATYACKPDRMVHLSMYADNAVKGIPSLEASARSIVQQRMARDWNNSLMFNGAAPNMVITAPYEMSSRDFDEMQEALQAKHAGEANAGRTMILDNGKDAKNLGFTAIEMDFTQSIRQSALEIAIAMAVPPELIGDSANKTYSNAVEAGKEFASHTQITLLDQMYEEFTQTLSPIVGKGHRLGYDVNEIDALRGDRSAMMAAVSAAPFLTINEKRELTGFPPLDEGGDVVLVPMGNIPLDDATDPLPPIPPMGD